MEPETDANWKTIGRAGYFGRLKQKAECALNDCYSSNWRIVYQFGEQTLSWGQAIKHYENSYVTLFEKDKSLQNWLVNTAQDVIDNAPSNINSGLNYFIQETDATHIQDIAIRNAIKRLGLSFKGNNIVKIRGEDSEGYLLNPGKVPFYKPEMILTPPRTGWWEPGSIEDFWQTNKIVQLKDSYLRKLLDDSETPTPGNSWGVKDKELDKLVLQWCSFGSERPTILGTAYSDEADQHLLIKVKYPYDEASYLSSREYHQILSGTQTGMDMILRISEQLPAKTIKRLRKFTKQIDFVS